MQPLAAPSHHISPEQPCQAPQGCARPILPVSRGLGQEVGTGTGCLAQLGMQALDRGSFLGLAEG